jgi:hypothetical protein
VKLALRENRDKVWEGFMEKMGPTPLSSRPFWQKINKFREKNFIDPSSDPKT